MKAVRAHSRARRPAAADGSSDGFQGRGSSRSSRRPESSVPGAGRCPARPARWSPARNANASKPAPGSCPSTCRPSRRVAVRSGACSRACICTHARMLSTTAPHDGRSQRHEQVRPTLEVRSANPCSRNVDIDEDPITWPRRCRVAPVPDRFVRSGRSWLRARCRRSRAGRARDSSSRRPRASSG